MTKALWAILVSVLVVSLVSSAALAATTTTRTAPARPGAGPGTITVTERTVNLTVVDVNPTARTITLRMPDGSTTTYRVPAQVRNLGQFKRGDTIRATVVDSMAVYIQKTGTRPSVTETQTVRLSPRGGKPGVITANTTRITGKIQSVDTANRTITVIGPGNRSRMYRVGTNVDMRNLRAGDSVVLRFTEAIALDLQRPAR